MPYLRGASRQTGGLYSLDGRLRLDFQLNPVTISRTKTNVYQNVNVPGWDSVLTYYAGGDTYTLEFEVSFDARAVRSEGGRDITLDGTPYLPALGVRPQIEKIETMLRPRPFFERNVDVGVDTEAVEVALQRDVYVPPPEMLFVYGQKVYRCVVTSAPITEEIHNELLVPTRASVSFSLLVLEDGPEYENNESDRVVLSYEAGPAPITIAL